ncbi:hypothetical protein SAMN05443247_06011 [Bradyrhizobium erythrophlei]|nr:hypothetical protein SAMN05443247_06011 [Bradyrhizobium erythrophlei]
MRVICIYPHLKEIREKIDPVASGMMSLISHRLLQHVTELNHGDGLYTFERYFGLRDWMEPFHLLSPGLICFGFGLVVGQNADGSVSSPKSSVQELTEIVAFTSTNSTPRIDCRHGPSRTVRLPIRVLGSMEDFPDDVTAN